MSFSQLLLAWSGTKIETRGSGPTSRVACPCPVRSSAIKMSPGRAGAPSRRRGLLELVLRHSSVDGGRLNIGVTQMLLNEA